MLHDAVKIGSIGIARILLKAGIDVNVQDVFYVINIDKWKYTSTLRKQLWV